MRDALRRLCVLGLAGVVPLAGCSTRVGSAARMAAEPADATSPALTPTESPTWDAALPGDFTALAGETSRRDEALNLQPVQPLLASNQWPHAPRPLFERARRVHLPREPRTVLHFLPPAKSR